MAEIQELTIRIRGKNNPFQLRAERDGRAVTVWEDFAFQRVEDLNDHLRVFYEHGNSGGQIDLVGRALFEVTFTPSIREAYDALMHKNQVVRLRISDDSESDAIHNLPWEIMRDEQGFLVDKGNLLFVRTDGEVGMERLPTITGVLRVLFVATMHDMEDSSVQGIAERVNEHFKANNRQQVEFEPLLQKDATFTRLSGELRKGYHIVCFLCHGDAKTASIMLASDYDEGGAAYPAEAIATLIKTSTARQATRLVMLLACRTGEAGEAAGRSFARALLKNHRLPAVIAMQREFDIQENTPNFAGHTLSALVNQQTIEEAMNAGRQQVTAEALLTPILYLQTREGRLFRRGANWRRYSMLIAGIALIIGVLLGGLLIQSRIERNVALIEEQTTRLQTLEQLARARDYQLPNTVSQPIIAGDDLWYGIQSQGVLRVRLDALGRERTLTDDPLTQCLNGIESLACTLIPLPLDDTPLLQDESYLWAVSADEQSVTRIDINSDTAQTIRLDENPSRMWAAGNYVWVSSGNQLIPIDRVTMQPAAAIPMPFTPGEPFSTDDALWIPYIGDDRLLRVSLETATAVDVALPLPAYSATFADRYVWISSLDGLMKLDPATNEVQILTPGYQLEQLRPAESFLWGIDSAQNLVVQFDSNQSSVAKTFPLADRPSAFFPVGDYLWVIAEGERLWLFNRLTGQLVTPEGIELRGASQITNIVHAQGRAWFTLPDQNAVLVINLGTGRIERRFDSLCRRPVGPTYDGANMWFACHEDSRPGFAHLPATMYGFGSPSLERAVHEYPIIERDGYLWVTQGQVGRVTAYNPVTNRDVNLLNLGASMLPLEQDGQYLWTAALIPNASPIRSRVYRLQPSVNPFGDYEAAVSIYEVDGEVYSLDVVHDHIWINHADYERLRETSTLTIIQRDSLSLVYTYVYQLLVSSVTPIGDDVWVGVSDFTDGYLYRLNARTGEQVNVYNPPQTTYAPWAPVEYDNRLWLFTGAPSLGNSSEWALSLMGARPLDDEDGAASGELEFAPDLQMPALYGLDFNNTPDQQWGPVYRLPGLPSRPLLDGSRVWLSNFSRPPVVVRRSFDNETSAYVFDLAEGRVVGETLNPCELTAGIHLVGSFAWIGCSAPESALWTINRQTLEINRCYANVGSRPWTPIVVGDYVWFTFQDSNNAAVFEIETGRLIRRIALGEQPGPPHEINGQIWVFNAGDGTLQLIEPEVAVNAAAAPNTQENCTSRQEG